MPNVVDFQWSAVYSSVIVLVTMVVALLFDLGTPRRWARPTGWVALIGVLCALGFAIWGTNTAALAFGARDASGSPVALLMVDAQANAFLIVCFIGTALTIFLSMTYLDRHNVHRGEYYVLILLALLGMALMATANDLIVLFLGLELHSLPLYILAGFRRNAESSEASLKHFLLGAFSSAFFLFGTAFVFGATGGSTNLGGVLDPNASPALLRIGITLIVVGLGFKVAAAPFHQWVPDVYQGAPTPVTAFFASAPKVAAFAAALRVMQAYQLVEGLDWPFLLSVLAALSMCVGNLMALTQKSVKRMLAYSSVAHAGYVLVGLAAGAASGTNVRFYLLVYSLMSVGAFGILILRGEAHNERLNLDDYAGLGHRRPILAAAMTIFMLSLAGFPPTAGFLGKFLLFREAYDAGLTWLVVVAVLNSVVAAYYYLGVVVRMYMAQPAADVAPSRVRTVGEGLLVAALVLALIGVLVGGILPSGMLELVGGGTAGAGLATGVSPG